MGRAAVKGKPADDQKKVFVGKAAPMVVGKAAEPVAGKAASKATRAAIVRHMVKVSFGGVTLLVQEPTPAEEKKRLNESKAVARKFSDVISRPGVRLAHKATTPTYTVDSRDPSLIVQKIGERAQRGRFKNGVFVPQ